MLWTWFALAALAKKPVVEADASTMVGHFEAATHAMLAVGTGEMKDARRQTKALTDHPGVPEPLEDAAKEVSHCKKVSCGGPAIAMMGRTCAVCHTDTGMGPRLPPMTEIPGRNQRERHTFAALYMWIGLVTPQEEAWTVGVQGAIPPIDLDSADELRPIEARFAQLVSEAEQTEDWDRRADQFGEMLSLCAECHEEAGLKK